jgi:hypothetical protein
VTIAILGNPTIGTTAQGVNWDAKRTNKVTMPRSGGWAIAMAVYVDGIWGATGNGVMKGVIYAADGAGGDPGTLLGTTAELTILMNQAVGWAIAAFAAGVWMAPADYYEGWHIGATDGNIRQYHKLGKTEYYNTDTYADGALNPFGAVSTRERNYSSYIIYNPVRSFAEYPVGRGVLNGVALGVS